MILKHFGSGTSQIVFQGDDKSYVYKFPLQRKYDSGGIPFTFQPQDEIFRLTRGFIRFLRTYKKQQRRYQRSLNRFEISIQILKRLEKLAQNGLQEFFPRTFVYTDHKSTHLINAKKYSYSGMMIKQEMVQEFFNNNVPLKSFDWQNIVDIETELWRYGIGLGATAETWGPKNWGRVQSGSIKLVDTSHLTYSFQLVSDLIQPETMEFRKEILLSKGNTHNPKDIEEYFRFMRTYLNMNNLQKNWRIYLNNNPSATLNEVK